MNTHNHTYTLFIEKGYSAKEIVNFLYQEIQIEEPKKKALAVIESLQLFVNQLKSEIYNVKIEFEAETGKYLKSLIYQLAAAVTYLEKIITNTITHYKNEINYKLKKLQQMRQEIAVMGLYLEV